MDLLCDTLLVEEIFPRLPAKYLHRLRAVSRRYNGIILSPEFAARYWQPRAGVFFQPFGLSSTDPEPVHRFLTCAGASASVPVPGADLAFMPSATAREEAYLRHVCGAPDAGLVVVHTASGLVLCARGHVHAAHYYVCNPVTWQWVALPELPCPSTQWQSGVLMVDTDDDDDDLDGAATAPTRFREVLFNQPFHWQQHGGRVDLRVFTSDTGRWDVKQLDPPFNAGVLFSPPVLLETGLVFWMRYDGANQAVAYDAAELDDTVYILKLPPHGAGSSWNRTLGQRQDGKLRYAHSDKSVLEVWELQLQDEQGCWVLRDQVGAVEIRQRNPGIDEFIANRTGEVSERGRLFAPLGFHPTDNDVVFLAVPGAVAAYSIEHGTVTLQCMLDEGLLRPYDIDMFPYVHPPYPVQIPAIKSSDDIRESLELPSPELILFSEVLPCSCIFRPSNQDM